MSVAELKAKRKAKKSSFNTYANRRDKVKKIISSIDNNLDDEVCDVNSKIDKCISELKQGLRGSAKVAVICADIEDEKERGNGADSNLVSCRSSLESEQSRCQGQINTLDAEIRSLENQIREQGGTIYFWE